MTQQNHPSALLEREDTIIRNILSGDNQCGTLQTAVANKDHEYFRRACHGSLAAYEDEARGYRIQRDGILKESEQRRQALEYVAANVQLTGEAAKIVGDALGRSLA